MPKVTGLGDNFYADGFDLSGDVASLDKISQPLQLLDATAMTQRAHARLKGKRDGAVSATVFMDTNFPVVASPGVPATTVPLVSTFPYVVRVTITGGTMSNVVINGTSVGSGAGTYALPAFGTITLTYTVAPTWVWRSLGTEHDALSTLPSADTICSYFQGATPGPSIGQPAASMVAKQTNYDPTRDANGNISLKVDWMANAFGLEWGKQLTNGPRVDNGPFTGPFFDQGAGSTFGCQAYLHIIELVGTNVQVTITHATTSGGSYTTLLDFGSQTLIEGYRAATSNVTTVNQFLKVVTAGTFTQAIIAVNFIQNPVAGVVF
jgi:hypothetical protein